MNSSDNSFPAPAAVAQGGPADTADRISFFGTRWANVLAGLVYIGLFLNIYRSYISPVWGYTGFYYNSLNTWEISFEISAVSIVSFFMPTKIMKPSSIILWLLYAFVFIPTIAITFMIGVNVSSFYVAGLSALSCAMIFCSLATSGNEPYPVEKDPSGIFVNFIIVAFFLMAISLFFVFRNILSFASVDDIYVQRFAASEISGGFIGYVRTYFSYVVCPSLMAIGIIKKKYYFIVLGIFGYILSYTIDAAKIALVIPAAVLIFVILKSYKIVSTSLYTFGIAIFAGFASLFTDYSSIVRFFADVLLLRTIAIPGQTFSQYYDLFEARGYTFWSNTKFVNLVVPPPVAFRSDPFWPVLGQIIGAEYYGSDSRMNANANLFVGEGIAAAGPLGVIAIGLLLAWWLRALDRYSRSWNRTFVIAVTIPIGMALTNVHLSTLLLSFGGLFWLIAYRFALSSLRAA